MNACSVSCKKIFQGGLAAGLIILLIEWVAHGVVLMPRYTELTRLGVYFSEPRYPYLPVSMFISLASGMVLSWLYARCRDSLGPGPRSALKLGLAIGILTALPGPMAELAWGAWTGKFVAFVTFAANLAEAVYGTFIAAYLYKPEGPTGGLS